MTGYNIYRTDGVAPIICCRKIWYIKIKSFKSKASRFVLLDTSIPVYLPPIGSGNSFRILSEKSIACNLVSLLNVSGTSPVSWLPNK